MNGIDQFDVIRTLVSANPLHETCAVKLLREELNDRNMELTSFAGRSRKELERAVKSDIYEEWQVSNSSHQSMLYSRG